MPHLRHRHASHLIDKLLGFSPLVGVLGHRQVGKTTLLEKHTTRYATLDIASDLKSANTESAEFLQKLAPKKGETTGIDETQLSPPLFPALKEWVRVHKRPGQFLLSGSVRFTSRSAIRESLTGRIVNIELYPMVLSELEVRELPNIVSLALSNSSLTDLARAPSVSAKNHVKRNHLIDLYYIQGGLPGVCFIRDDKIRSLKILEQIRTVLDRDIRLIQKTNLSYSDIFTLCQALAEEQGEPIDYSSLQATTGISVPTIKKLIYALEALFIIRTISIEGGRKGFTLYFEDMGEFSIFNRNKSSAKEKLTHFCFCHLRAQTDYRLGSQVLTFQYRTRGGAVVPLAYRGPSGTLGIIPIDSSEEAARAIPTANSFLKSNSGAKVLLVHRGTEKRLIQDNILLMPVTEIV